MEQQVEDLAVAWWKQYQAMEASQAKIKLEIKNYEVLRDKCSDLDARICKAADPGTKVVTVEPGVCVVLAWDNDHGCHTIEAVEGANIASRVWTSQE